MPDWVVLLLFVFVPAVGAILIHGVVRRAVPAGRLIPHHDVAGFLVAIVGVLYAVVLGFMVVTVWANFDSIQRTADTEAGFVADIYGMASMLPEPQRTTLRSQMANYAYRVSEYEWKSLSKGEQDRVARACLFKVIGTITQTPPRHGVPFETALHDQMLSGHILDAIRNLADSRRLRIIQAQSHLPPVLYLALILGGVMVLGFVFLFGVENRMLQSIMTGIVAGCIGLLFGMVVEFSAPYSGGIRISNEAWTYVLHNNHMDRYVKNPSTTPVQP